MNRAAADNRSQDLAYFTAKSTVDAFEEKRAAQAAKEAEVKAAEEAKKCGYNAPDYGSIKID